MSIEDLLRSSLSASYADVQADDRTWHHIEEDAMARHRDDEHRRRRGRALWAAGGAIVAAAAILVAVVLLNTDDSTDAVDPVDVGPAPDAEVDADLVTVTRAGLELAHALELEGVWSVAAMTDPADDAARDELETARSTTDEQLAAWESTVDGTDLEWSGEATDARTGAELRLADLETYRQATDQLQTEAFNVADSYAYSAQAVLELNRSLGDTIVLAEDLRQLQQVGALADVALATTQQATSTLYAIQVSAAGSGPLDLDEVYGLVQSDQTRLDAMTAIAESVSPPSVKQAMRDRTAGSCMSDYQKTLDESLATARPVGLERGQIIETAPSLIATWQQLTLDVLDANPLDATSQTAVAAPASGC